MADSINFINLLENKIEIPQNMADIKPVIEFEKSSPLFLKIFIVVIVLLLIILAIYFLVRYFKNKKSKINDEVPFYLESIKKLEILENIDTNVEEKWFKLSALFREYINKRYNIDALNLGETELESKILQFIPEIYVSSIENFLTFCKLNKFSNKEGLDDNFYEQAEILKEFINVTGTAFEQSKRDG